MDKSTTQEFRSGAIASFEALRIITRIASTQDLGENKDPDAEDRKFFFLRDQELIKTALLNSAGPISPFIRGFLCVLGEYIGSTVETGGADLYIWKPACLMSVQQREAEVDEIFSDEIPGLAPRFISIRETLDQEALFAESADEEAKSVPAKEVTLDG
ncbi:hypothetical protein SAMN05216428_11286 [Nitrosospira sp. Nsp11]|uniref:hypothetical protein n=1 Tax=Nitrosospira sp. Nsp11 TaxID=1855338 RepID=UPI0009237858|nr:hypothetical protein [Nitrosospira sp. Nsp11]SHM05371.1 hypothetical protein SAMN05216428_11286 [Nitrosospira sp. Nsp11]